MRIHTRADAAGRARQTRHGTDEQDVPVAPKALAQANSHMPATNWARPPTKKAMPMTTLGVVMPRAWALYIERMKVVLAKPKRPLRRGASASASSSTGEAGSTKIASRKSQVANRDGEKGGETGRTGGGRWRRGRGRYAQRGGVAELAGVGVGHAKVVAHGGRAGVDGGLSLLDVGHGCWRMDGRARACEGRASRVWGSKDGREGRLVFPPVQR